MKKKLLALCLCTILTLSSLLLIGCDKDDSNDNMGAPEGFTAVCSVEYKLKGSNYEHYLNSEFHYQYNLTAITIEEYESSNLPENYLESADTMDAKKHAPDKISELNIEYKYYSDPHYPGEQYLYFIGKLTKITESYVYIKVHNDGSLEYIDVDGSHFRITTEYYKIEYFI